ncbi:MAG: OmpA family protein, partial [Alphaproteobacteria bacterium]|nr:OmpA family protein [Alphaproteobacteria bacterium]
EPRAEVTGAAEIEQALSGGADSSIDLTVNFPHDSADIEGKAHVQIYEIATALKSDSLRNMQIRIEGHTDNTGEDSYNMDLSYRRALSVLRALTEEYEVDNAMLQVQGFGETQPVASNETEAGRSLNRRVTLVNLGAAE